MERCPEVILVGKRKLTATNCEFYDAWGAPKTAPVVFRRLDSNMLHLPDETMELKWFFHMTYGVYIKDIAFGLMGFPWSCWKANARTSV